MSKAESDLRELGDIFGAVADGYFDVDAQIANGMGMMGASLDLDRWKDDKAAWDYLQAHRGDCVPGPDGSMPGFCSATDPGPPPTDLTITTDTGSVHTHLTLDENNNVIKEETTVVNGDQRYTSTTTYTPDHTSYTTDTTYSDGSTTHSVTTTGEHGSSVTDTTSGDGSTTHTVIALNEGGGGTMTVTESDGTVTKYTRGDQYARWDEVEKTTPEDDTDYSSYPTPSDSTADRLKEPAMPNISLDYDKIEATSTRLDGAVRDILPMLESLRSDVANLLEDGLVFQQSSPAMKESYDKFNTSLLAAMKGINDFAKQFRDIRTSMEEMDVDMAGKIRSAGSCTRRTRPAAVSPAVAGRRGPSRPAAADRGIRIGAAARARKAPAGNAVALPSLSTWIATSSAPAW